jgi:hypothetical protein
MSNPSDSLDQQIAALEEALKLPLPEATRVQIEQDVRALRTQRSAQLAGTVGAKIEGRTDVSGTLHGAAIGVNLGTVQTAFGASPLTPGAQPTSDVSPEEIDDQRELLDAHRRTLAVYLKQQARLGSAYAPPGVANGIREARAAIRRVKATLSGWGAAIADHPDDEAPA